MRGGTAPPSTSSDKRRMYGDLAWLWPIVSSPEHYVGEARLFARLIRKHSKIPAKSLLHLGCGGGHIDLTLKKRFEVTGVDLSGEMLKLAGKLNPEVEYIKGDMRAVRLRRIFDAVVVADSITYMTSEKDLRRAFATAFKYLRPGGVFCTYAELTVKRFKQNLTEVTTCRREDVDAVFMENTYDPDPSDTTCEFTFVYLIRHRGRLRIETDNHVAGLLKLQSWIDALEETGFKVKMVEYPAERMPMFICVKPQSR